MASMAAGATKIHVYGFYEEIKPGLIRLVKDYFSQFGEIRFSQKVKFDPSVIQITFKYVSAVANVMNFGSVHRIWLYNDFRTVHVKALGDPSYSTNITEVYIGNNFQGEKRRRRNMSNSFPAAKRRRNKSNVKARNSETINSSNSETINPKNSSKIYVTNYSMGIPSVRMDDMLKRYFKRFGQTVAMRRPPEHNGKVAILTLQNPSQVTKIVKLNNHKLFLNKFNAFCMLEVKVWDEPDQNDNAGTSTDTSNNQVTEKTSQQSDNAPKVSGEKCTDTIFCTGYPVDPRKEMKMTKILTRHFCCYGEVVSVSYPCKFDSSVALIKFRKPESALSPMKHANNHRIPMTQGGNHCGLYVDLYLGYKPFDYTVLNYESCFQSKVVSEQICKLIELMTLTKEDCEARRLCVKDIENIVKADFPNGKSIIFGQSVNNFGYKKCSLDFIFEPEPGYLEQISFNDANSGNGISPLNLSAKLNSILNPNKVTDQNAVEHNPEYVTYFDEKRKFHCRIWCHNLLPVYKSDLLTFYSQFDSRVVPLMMCLRFWAKHHKIFEEIDEHDGSKFSEDALTWMLIFFLQNINPRVVPTVRELMSKAKESRKVLGFETAFCNDVKPDLSSSNDSSVEILLWEFFVFYYNYDYSCVICPLDGKPKYRKHFIADEKSKQQFQNSLLCVQDPIETSRNLAFNIKSELFCTFASKCKYAETFNPNEVKLRQPYKFWGLMHLYTGVPCFENMYFESWECLQPNSIKFCVRYKYLLPQRIISDTPKPRKSDPKLLYELVTAAILYILNHALLFNASIHPGWEFKELEKQKTGNSNDSCNNAKGEKDEMGARENHIDVVLPDFPLKKFRDNTSVDKKALLDIDKYRCNVDIKAKITHDTWNKRWSYSLSDELESEETYSEMSLDRDRNVSVLLKTGQVPFNSSLTCHCCFDGSKGFTMGLKCDDNLVDSNLLSFLTYFIALKLNELFNWNLTNFVSRFLSKDLFV